MDNKSISDPTEFKALVDKHRAEGWANLAEDKKLFICSYIKAGYSIAAMLKLEDGLMPDEATAYLTDPLIRAAIKDVGEQYAEITTFTIPGLQARLARALDMAMGEIPTPEIHKGYQIFARRVNHTAIAKYIEMAERYADMDGEDKVSETTPWVGEFPNG